MDYKDHEFDPLVALDSVMQAWLIVAQLSDRARLARLDVLHGR